MALVHINPRDVGVVFALANSPSAAMASTIFWRARQVTPPTPESPYDVPHFEISQGAIGLPHNTTAEALTARMMSRVALFIGVVPNDALAHVLQCTARIIIVLPGDTVLPASKLPFHTHAIPGKDVCYTMWEIFFPRQPPPMAVCLLSGADMYNFEDVNKESALAFQRALKEPNVITADLLSFNRPLVTFIKRGQALLDSEAARRQALLFALKNAPTRAVHLPYKVFARIPAVKDPPTSPLIRYRMIDSPQPGDRDLWVAVADEFYDQIPLADEPHFVAFLSPPGINDVGSVKVSLRRNNDDHPRSVDLAHIAALYGGCGRSGAAHFMLPTLLMNFDPFPPPPDEAWEHPE